MHFLNPSTKWYCLRYNSSRLREEKGFHVRIVTGLSIGRKELLYMEVLSSFRKAKAVYCVSRSLWKKEQWGFDAGWHQNKNKRIKSTKKLKLNNSPPGGWKVVSFLFSGDFSERTNRESRINPEFFGCKFGWGFIFVQPSQVYLPKMMQVREKPGIPGFFRVLRAEKGPSRRDVFEWNRTRLAGFEAT